MHIGKRMTCRAPAQFGVEPMQLLHRIRPEAGEHDIAVDLERLVPALDQGLRVGCRMQQHIGPEHVHAGICGRPHLHGSPLPARELPPAAAELVLGHRLAAGYGFIDRAFGLRITLAQQMVCLHATANRLPVAPGLGRLHDPVQALLHAAGHLLVQPGRFGRSGHLPMVCSCRINCWRQDVGHGQTKAGRESSKRAAHQLPE